ncbi:MAG: UvrB/UvrC motif-containing protein [Desulfotomaculaceae bacterium]|nr:UvrB/UvrC motif-containing protein [Desulfotomaculaceae bacterium]
MFCEKCNQRPATVHIAEIINGQKQETHLCEICAKEIKIHGFGFFPQMNLNKFMAGLLNGDFNGSSYNQTGATGKVCEKCGVSEEQFANKGLLGCGECYPYFEEKMLPLLRRIHGNMRHVGKIPERKGGRARLVKEIEIAKRQLKEAVDHEEFELAAQLRDNIRQLEKSFEEGGEG